jgi:hypothetical protein
MACPDSSPRLLQSGEALKVDLGPTLEGHNAVRLLVHVSQLGVAVTGKAGLVLSSPRPACVGRTRT